MGGGLRTVEIKSGMF